MAVQIHCDVRLEYFASLLKLYHGCLQGLYVLQRVTTGERQRNEGTRAAAYTNLLPEVLVSALQGQVACTDGFPQGGLEDVWRKRVVKHYTARVKTPFC